MGWNYIVETNETDDLKSQIIKLAEDYRDSYPGVAREHAIADMPLVAEACDAAVSFLTTFASPGEKFRVNVSGSSKHEDAEYASVEVRKIG